ncbi:hypothetical protein QUB80_01475 [Chlorogloeopsis sp. ULAP01]|uniref:hypothetical protein n=1 Tax=Chlorogloeopsis sp. ULAP01 TaxID=3056483 RepID=UPI0025AB0255|nr:hypothetical protein [Chlorogloeopsis sp. ULAP01]MDM9379377.1 hypothetical protein [Chlorogloeopsis sp. ULAP01]
MIQEIRSNEPQYICVVKVDSLTNNEDEEIMAFGVSEDDAKNQAQQLLARNYECNESQILELIQEARIEPIGQWCAPQERQV